MSERVMADPEPTPDRAVGEDKAVDPTSLAAKAYQEGRARAMNDHRRAESLYEEVMRQIHVLNARLSAATERPADGGVTISRDHAESAVQAMVQMRDHHPPYSPNWKSWNGKINAIRAALSTETTNGSE